MENWKGKEFDGFQIILKLEICAEKIVFNCSTLKKNRLLFVTFKKQSRRDISRTCSSHNKLESVGPSKEGERGWKCDNSGQKRSTKMMEAEGNHLAISAK